MIVAAARETFPGERRVALIPPGVARLIKAGCEVFIEAQAGLAAGFSDADYREAGAKIVSSRDEAFAADVVFVVRTLGANPAAAAADLELFHPKLSVIGMCDPLGAPGLFEEAAATGAAVFALDLLPPIARARSMDVLSSMATLSGYRAVLLAALELPRIMPMLTTAAGTLTAAKVLVLGAGVAGLQAIATARRLGGAVQGYDQRPVAREQMESLGAKFLALPLAAGGAEDEAFYQKLRELLGDVIAPCDVVICTAAIPGKKSPLITKAAIERMQPGAVVVDLAEQGGNCELTVADRRTVHQGVTILGPTNLPSEVPRDASQMLSNNYLNFFQHLGKSGQLTIDEQDEIAQGTLVTHHGQIVNRRIVDLLAGPPLEAPPEVSATPTTTPSSAGDATTGATS